MCVIMNLNIELDIFGNYFSIGNLNFIRTKKAAKATILVKSNLG